MFTSWLNEPCLSNVEPSLTSLDFAELWHFAQRHEVAELEGRCIVNLFNHLNANFSIPGPQRFCAESLEKEKEFFAVVLSAGPTTKIAEMVVDYMIQAICRGNGREVMHWYEHMPVAMTGRILWRQSQILITATERSSVLAAPPFDVRNYLQSNANIIERQNRASN
jgi:hypothetical protein